MCRGIVVAAFSVKRDLVRTEIELNKETAGTGKYNLYVNAKHDL